MKSSHFKVAAVLLLLFCCVGQAAESIATIESIKANLEIVKTNVANLKSIKPWLLSLAILTIALGLTSSIIQSFERIWVKRATVAIGATIASLGALKSTIYRIDYTMCDSMIVQVESLVKLQEKALTAYEQPDLLPEQKVQAFKWILRNEESLQRLAAMLRESGQPILPTIASVVLAQSHKPIYGNTPGTGSGLATTKEAAYQYAKYRALNQLAEQVRPPLQDSEVNSAILYINKMAEPQSSSCRASNQMHSPGYFCSVEYRFPIAALQRDVMKELGVFADVGQPEFLLRGSAVYKWPNAYSLPINVIGVNGATLGKFEFTFITSYSNSNSGELRLAGIKCFDAGAKSSPQAGLWAFEASVEGSTLRIPVANYEDSGHPTVYSAADGRSLLPRSGIKEIRLTVVGYRPTPAFAK